MPFGAPRGSIRSPRDRGYTEATIGSFASYLDPEAAKINVAGLHRILLEKDLTHEVQLEDADVVFCDWPRYARYSDLRRDRNLSYVLNQVPHATRELHRKERFAINLRRRPHVLETYVASGPRRLRGIWVEKPFNVDRGKGLAFLRDPRAWRRTGHVLQRYLETPWLVNDRKIDVRVFALIRDDGTVRVHREGLVRCAHRPFSLDDLDPLIHNSNSLFQKRHGVVEVEQHVLSELVTGPAVMDAMVELIEDSVAVLRRKRCFKGKGDIEAVGYDFVVDADGYPWALEANRFPGLYFDHPAADRFHRGMIDDLYADLG